MGKNAIKKTSDKGWVNFFLVGLGVIIILLAGMIANLYDKNADSMEVIGNLTEKSLELDNKITNTVEVVGSLQEEGWALALSCIAWEDDYCNELVAYNMSGSTVYQPRGTFEEDCNQYCTEQSIRRIKLSFG